MSQDWSEYYSLENKKWRAITPDWNVLSTYSEHSKLYCLTDFQAAWLLSQTEYMHWKTRWQNCPCTQSDLDAMKAGLEYNLMNCFDTRWMGQLQYVYDEQSAEQLDVFQTAYDAGGIPALNPDTPTDFYDGNGSVARVNALCMACDTYVRSYLNNWLSKAALFIGLVSILGIFVSVTPVTGLIAGVIIGGLAFMTQTVVDAIADEQAVEDVVCCMFTTLQNSAVNELNFEISLGACGFPVGSNQAIIRDLVASDMNQFKNWLSFLNTLGDCYVFMLAGVDYTCPCQVTPTWTHLFDFEASDGGWTQITTGIVSGTAGVWVAGSGWQATDTSYNPSTFRRLALIERTFPSTVITKITVTYDLTKDTTWANPAEFIINDAYVSAQARLTYANAVDGNGQTIIDSGSNTRTKLTLRHLSSLSNTPGHYAGIATIKSIFIEGEGTNPF